MIKAPKVIATAQTSPTSRILVVLTPRFMLDVGRVIKSLTHFRASTKWVRTFDPDIIYTDNQNLAVSLTLRSPMFSTTPSSMKRLTSEVMP